MVLFCCCYLRCRDPIAVVSGCGFFGGGVVVVVNVVVVVVVVRMFVDDW